MRVRARRGVEDRLEDVASGARGEGGREWGESVDARVREEGEG